MSTTVTGKLNKPANIFQAGDSTGFSIRVGVKYRDPKTKLDEWTNYSAVIFAKSPGQIQFYTDALVEHAIVEVTAEQLKVDSFDGQNGTVLSIDMLNARLGYVHNPNAQQSQGAPQQQAQGGYQQAPQQQAPMQQAPQYPQQQGGGFAQQAPQQQQQHQGGYNPNLGFQQQG